MPKPKAASLDPSLVAMPKKGQAAPGSAIKGSEEVIAITVRLDKERYRRLKLYGLDHRQSTQQIMVKAMDAFLDANT